MIPQTTAHETAKKNPPVALDAESTLKAAEEDPVNDYSRAPQEVDLSNEGIGNTMGSATGEDENGLIAGGWQGTDDATSTAPSDVAFDVPQKPMNHAIGEDADEDPTGRAYGGGLNPEDGGVADLTGKAIGESRNWETNPVDLEEPGV